MKIIFLNTWNGNIRDHINDFIKNQVNTTDIFCFQEAYDKMRDLCSPLLSNFVLVKDYKYFKENEDFPQATYINKSFKIQRYETIMKETQGTGLALFTKILVDNKTLNLINVHGISKPGNKLDTPERILQSKEILKFCDGLKGPIVIGGDFNLEIDTESISIFEEHEYENLIKTHGITNTRNKYVWDRYPDSKQYYADFCFVNSKLHVKSFEVPYIEISDHLPMILEIEL